MNKNNRNNEQIYGRNDMIMLDPNNKIYGSLGLADNYVMKTEEGTRLTLSNPKQGRFADVLTEFNIYGRSEQFSTTGAQLFNENIEIESRGVIIKINGSTATFEGTVSDEVNSRVNCQKNIKLKPGKYTASSSNEKIFADFFVKKANDEMIYNNHIEIDGTEKEVKIRVLFGLKPSAKGDVINETTNIMLNDGDIALPYEPYTGGQPSPSPDYPQEIKSVGDSGSIEVNVRGKNLVDVYGYSASGMFNLEAERVLSNVYGTTLSTTEKTDKLIVNQEIIEGATADSYTSGYFCVGINRKLEAGKDYIITFKINVIQNPFHVSNIIVMFNGIGAYMGNVVEDKVTVKVKYNESDERQYVEIRNRGMSLELSNFMITEVGETDDYEQYYEEQTVTLPYTLNAIPVSSGGNVTINGQQYIADRVIEKDGVFGIERNTATDVPVLTKELRETPDMKGRFIQDGALKKIFTPFYETLVNIGYSRKWGVAGSVIDKWIFGVNKVNLYISPPKDLNYTSEDIFNALKDLNIKVYGALLVPFFEPLPEDIQAKLRTLVIHYPVTIIENNYNTWMKATYKSTESV